MLTKVNVLTLVDATDAHLISRQEQEAMALTVLTASIAPILTVSIFAQRKLT